MLESSRIFLIGRGYNPNFSEEGWRKIAYTLTQATLEAYEGIKKRQEGAVVTETSTDILPSQFIVPERPQEPHRTQAAKSPGRRCTKFGKRSASADRAPRTPISQR